jgi:predicted membrane-bound dolichyl-phosphate-mannose-protein mannosyltransferase
MALGLVIPSGVFLCKVITGTATLVAVKTPLLLMALATVVAGLAGQNPVATHEIRIMVKCNTFRLMAGVAFLDCHVLVFSVVCLLFGVRLLLEADKSKTENY